MSQSVEVRQTDAFARWFTGLSDREARSRILVRIRRLSLGNRGDARSLGGGISELRIHAGPGYRIYFTTRGRRVVILLGGGDKATQRRDIAAARHMARELEEA